MSSNSISSPAYYADFSGLEGLKKGVKADDPKATREAARQFESLFTNMLLKSMREAKLGDGMGDSQETDFYQDMFDQQLSVQMSQGKGIGLAEMLVQQLTRSGATKAAGTSATTGAGALTTSATGTAAATSKATTASAASPGAATGAGGGPATDADRISFIQRLEPYAQRAATQLGVSSDTLIAHAALETGWGRHIPADTSGGSSFNLFGIKSGTERSGDVVNARTLEYTQAGATSVSQPFRAYSSLQQGVNDYAALLQRSPSYRDALGTGNDVSAFAGALKRGGYATDPNYVQKLAATAASVKALRAAAVTAPLNLQAGQPMTTGGEPA
jgi:flagellar protein FlgJ